MTSKKNVIFLHMPKCAGSSMFEVFQLAYGTNLKRDYDSFFQIPRKERFRAITSAISDADWDTGESMIFGHFFPIKYLANLQDDHRSNWILATFLRDPLERLASHYAFWKRTDFSNHYLWIKMTQENWSFPRFALSIEMKDFYSQYLFQVPISSFDFIGIHENLERDWDYLCKLLEIEPAELPHVNQSDTKGVLSEISCELKAEIRYHHSEDYFIYDFAVRQASRRI